MQFFSIVTLALALASSVLATNSESNQWGGKSNSGNSNSVTYGTGSSSYNNSNSGPSDKGSNSQSSYDSGSSDKGSNSYGSGSLWGDDGSKSKSTQSSHASKTNTKASEVYSKASKTHETASKQTHTMKGKNSTSETTKSSYEAWKTYTQTHTVTQSVEVGGTTVISIIISTELASSSIAAYIPVVNTIITTETHSSAAAVNTIFSTEIHSSAAINTVISTAKATVTAPAAIMTFASPSFSLITATNTSSPVQQANQTTAPVAFTGDAASSFTQLWTVFAAGSLVLVAVLL